MGKLTEHPAIHEGHEWLATCPSCFGDSRVDCQTCEGVGELDALEACSMAANLFEALAEQANNIERAETSLALAEAERDSLREQIAADRKRYQDESALMLSVSEQQAARISQLMRGAT